MWTDNETDKDFLNFSCTADTVAELIIQAKNEPVSIGVSGQWGVGKSSMIKLIKKSLNNKGGAERFVFVEFNAWLYQGYDDARAALMDVIADALNREAEKRQTGVEKATEFLKRVNWLRVAKTAATTAASFALGIPPTGLLNEAFNIAMQVKNGTMTEEDLKSTEDLAFQTFNKISGYLKPKEETSPPKEIQAIRDCFEQTLNEIGITLVVLIDDLDRCLPQTTISTLEAIRLFLFLKNTAFVIAADDKMVKHAVKVHFDGIDNDLVTNYFDKLIQIPLRVPALGTQEVRAYLILLYVDASELSNRDKETIRESVCTRLSESWKGKRVDRAFVSSLGISLPSSLISQIETADRLAHIMTTSSMINGNPRLIKRFLNTLSIRMSISKSHGVGVDEAVLVKLLLFERCGNPIAYSKLLSAVNENSEGQPVFLGEWEVQMNKDSNFQLKDEWSGDFIKEWLKLSPTLADKDLRGALYVSREHAPIITPEDRLSSIAADLLEAILKNPDVANSLKEDLNQLPRMELSVIMDKLLEKAKQEQEWGVPAILKPCLTVSAIDETQARRLVSFLMEIMPAQIKPNLVAKLNNEPWSSQIFEKWLSMPVDSIVKKAINNLRTK